MRRVPSLVDNVMIQCLVLCLISAGSMRHGCVCTNDYDLQKLGYSVTAHVTVYFLSMERLLETERSEICLSPDSRTFFQIWGNRASADGLLPAKASVVGLNVDRYRVRIV